MRISWRRGHAILGHMCVLVLLLHVLMLLFHGERGLDVEGGIRSTQEENHVNKKRKTKVAVTLFFFFFLIFARESPSPFFILFVE